MNLEQQEVLGLLERINEMDHVGRISELANYLGFRVGADPVNPDSNWSMLLHEDLDPREQAVLAVFPDNELTESTSIQEVRKRHEHVIGLKENLGASFIVPVAAFIGKKRIVIYRVGAGNRDERLDLTPESVKKVPLYAEHFNGRLKKEHLRLKEDEFGFGYDIIGLDDLFKRSLSGRFQQTIELYRKKLSEAIVGSSVRTALKPLIAKESQSLLESYDMSKFVEEPSFKSALGCIVDTMILRQLLRRFLEGYHGIDSFNVSGIALGIGPGTLESALQEVVQVYRPEFDDKALQKALRKQRTVSKQLSMFDLFEEEELAVTSSVTFKENGEDKIIDLYEKIRRQFEIAYGGDLFAGSVASATNEVEKSLVKEFPELMAKLWADTSTDQYSFRYEDLPPELLQQQYEASMSRAVQIQLQEGKPVVFYGDDKQEQKEKGAYYTDTRLVDYMVKKSLEPIFEERLEVVRLAIREDDLQKMVRAIESILSLKVVDMTCGGGSFLRGAFYWLSDRHQTLGRLKINEQIIEQFPMLNSNDEGRHEWEKHLLTNVLYGVDIDYKALIICSQTLTLSALRHWQVGEGFPELIGRTLIHQNALISPVPLKDREAAYKPLKKDIKKILEVRKQGNSEKAEVIRQKLQASFKTAAHELLGESADMLFVESLEINIPEVFFDNDGTWKNNGGFDVALGNPPWEIWKPNGEEFFERYEPTFRKANKQQKLKMESTLFSTYPVLKERWDANEKLYAAGSRHFLDNRFYEYQRWKVDGKFTGSDVNLYKVSIERFYQIVKKDGRLSILVPGNIATDRGATGLRHLLFEESVIEELLSFENKKGIFETVHRSYKIALVTITKKTPEKDLSFKAFFYRHELEDVWNESLKLDYTVALAKKGAPDTWGLLELREQKEVELLNTFYNNKFPLLNEEIAPWKLDFQSELHMSADSSIFRKYGTTPSGLPLYEGKTIFQYENKGPVQYEVERKDLREKWLLKEKKRIVQQASSLLGLGLEESVKAVWGNHEQLEQFLKGPDSFYRLAYREVARATDRRTLISTILPKNSTSSNTLVSINPMKLKIENNNPIYDYSLTLPEQLALLGVFNSFTIDFIIRRKVGIHVSLFLMYQLPIPRLTEGNYYFQEIVSRSAHLVCVSPEFDELAKEVGLSGYEEGITDPDLRQLLQNQIDAYVASIYGLTRQELIYILSTFESAKHKAEMRRIGQGIVEAFDELKQKGALLWPI